MDGDARQPREWVIGGGSAEKSAASPEDSLSGFSAQGALSGYSVRCTRQIVLTQATYSKEEHRAAMTNDPRYSPPPPPGPSPPRARHEAAAPGYPGPAPHRCCPQQSYDWRYATQQPQPQYRGPHDPVPDRRPHPDDAGAPIPAPPQKRSRAGRLTVGALAIAVVSAGIGGGVATLVQPGHGPR